MCCYGELAADAGDEKTLAALGSDGSEVGEDAGEAAIGVEVTGAVGAVLTGSFDVLLLQPTSDSANTGKEINKAFRMKFLSVQFV